MPEGKKIGEAFVRVRPDTKGANLAFKAAGVELGEETGRGIVSTLTGTVGKLLAGVQVFKFLQESIARATEAARLERVTEAALASTGSAAWISAKQIDALSLSLSNMSAIDNEQVHAAENMLLTFENVRNVAGKNNDIFNQASVAAVNLSVAMKEDLRSAVIQVGKALQDPVRGATALRRVGVALTTQQTDLIKALVKSGHTLDAQKIILHELGIEFAGVAQASAGPAAKAANAWRNVQLVVGNLLLPTVSKVFGFITDSVVPGVQKFIDIVREGFDTGAVSAQGFWGKVQAIAATVKNVIVTLRGGEVAPEAQNVWTQMADIVQRRVLPVVAQLIRLLDQLFHKVLIPALQQVGPALASFVTWLQHGSQGAKLLQALVVALVAGFVAYKVALIALETWTKLVAAAQLLWNLAMEANPVVLILTAIVALAAAMVYLLKAGNPVGDWFRRVMLPALRTIWGFITQYFIPAVVSIAKHAFAGLVSAVKMVGDAIKAHQHQLENMLKVFLLLGGAVIFLVLKALPILGPVLQVAFKILGFAIAQVINTISIFIQYLTNLVNAGRAVGRFFSQTLPSFFDEAIKWIKGLPQRILDALGDLGGLLYNAGKDVIMGLIHGIESMGSELWDRVTKFIKDNVPGPVAKILGLASPSKLFYGFGRDTIRGYWLGVQAEALNTQRAMVAAMPTSVPGLGGAAGLPSGGNTINQTFNIKEQQNPQILAKVVSRELAWATGV